MPRPKSEREAGVAGVTVSNQDGLPELEDGDVLKVKFVGMSTELVQSAFAIGAHTRFAVTARCVGIGEEELADGHVRRFAKMKVETVAVSDRTKLEAVGDDA